MISEMINRLIIKGSDGRSMFAVPIVKGIEKGSVKSRR
jgi:hypothetical protein